MPKKTDKVAASPKPADSSKERSARAALLEELFEDYYKHRRKLYRMNFLRGLFFGLGSVLGGTVVIALLVWLLSFFVNFPLIGELIEDTQRMLDKTNPE